MGNPLTHFHPLIQQWFEKRLGAPTDIQARAWPVIAQRKHVLITAPTGSGKTLTAFLWAINQLVTGTWTTGATRVLYVSPLKALNNDIRRNLLRPLAELREIFAEAGETYPEVRVQVRSGDTPASERQRMARRPPEILITTPESLNLLLSSPRARDTLRGVRTVILDEIHAAAGSKRGTHLITAVERVAWLSGEFQRIALSATVRPLDRIADFIGGYEVEWEGIEREGVEGEAPSEPVFGDSPRSDPSPPQKPSAVYRKRRVAIIESKAEKRYELSVRYPPLRQEHPDDGARWPALADEFKKTLARNAATLIFVNTRRHCERISLHLNKDEPEIIAYAHHGSLSREMREVVEQRLKEGSLKAIVATSSLELGIDIGHLDEVILVQTPYSVSSTLQRLGRAGHRVGEVSRGALYPIFSHDILQAAVMTQAVQEAAIESIVPPANPLDVLAQVILSMTAIDSWDIDRLYDVIRACAPYHSLPRRLFDLIVDMLAGRYAGNRVRALDPLVSVDAIDNTIRARRGALLVLYSSGGTIPDRGYFNLRLRDSKAKIGELDEEFVWERHLGETFALGTQTWKIQEITHNDVLVTPGTVRPQDVPFWKADQITRKHHFSERVASFLESASARDGSFVDTLMRDHSLDREAAQMLVEYLARQREATGADLPHRHHVLIEFCRDHRRGNEHVQCILHTFWGGSVNRPFAFALAQAFMVRFNQRAEVFANNDAVVLVLPEGMESLDPFALVYPAGIEKLLRQNLEQTGYFGARFRENAARALLLPKQGFGKRMPLWMYRIRSKRLLDVVAGFENFPILLETWRTCLQDEFELDILKSLLDEVSSGAIRTTIVRTSLPSPFASAIVWGETNQYMYADDSPDSPITSRLSDDALKDAVFTAELRPQIDPKLVAEFQAKAQRAFPGYSPATPDELLDWIKEHVFIPTAEWGVLLDAIQRDHGLTPSELFAQIERKLSLSALGVSSRELSLIEGGSRGVSNAPPDQDEDPLPLRLEQFLRFYGPVTTHWLCETLPIEKSRLESALDSLVDANTLLRGQLTLGAASTEVCDAENFEILLRLARKQARPVFTALPIERLQLFLAAQQGLARGSEHAEDLPTAIEPLFGFPMPAELLEREVLPARLDRYTPSTLDTLAADSGLQWIGAGPKRVYLTVPQMLDLFSPQHNSEDPGNATLEQAAQRILPSPIGRFTFTDLLDYSREDSSTLNSTLWDLAWNARIANGFQTLRKGVATNFKAPSVTSESRTGRRAAFQAWKATRNFTGDWYRLPAPEPPSDLLEEAELIKDRARVVLDRYGIVFRQLLQNELPSLRWGAVFKALRLMELSGEIAAGYFFADVPGLQFASLPALRSLQRPLPEDAVYWFNALDPASLCGVDVDALKSKLPTRVKSTHVVFHGDKLVLVSQRSGKVLDFRIPPDDPNLPRYLVLFDHLVARAVHPMKNVALESINGQPAARSPYLAAFRDRFEVVAGPRDVSLWHAPVRT